MQLPGPDATVLAQASMAAGSTGGPAAAVASNFALAAIGTDTGEEMVSCILDVHRLW